MVAQPHPTRADHAPDWQIVRDVYAGERAIKARGDQYLPRIGAMVKTGDPIDDEAADRDFGYYKLSARVTPYFHRAVSIFRGKVSRKPSTTNYGGCAELEEWVNDVDGRGSSLETWLLKRAVTEAMLPGVFGVYVDSASNRDSRWPALRGYSAENIWNWETEGGRIEWLILREVGVKQTITQGVNVEQVSFTHYRKLSVTDGYLSNELFDDQNQLISGLEPMLNGAPMDHIPFFALGAYGSDLEFHRPPMLDLANAILDLYRLSAKQRRCFDLASAAAFYATGLTADETFAPTLGSFNVTTLPEPSGKIGVAEYVGHALKEIMAEIKECQQVLVALGAKMLQPENPSNVPAETARLNNGADVNVLANLINNLSAAVTELLKYICRVWFKADDTDVKFQFNLEFFEEAPNPQLLSTLLNFYERDALRLNDLYHHLSNVGLLEPGADKQTWIEDIQALARANQDIAAMLGQFAPAPAPVSDEAVTNAG